MKAWDVTCKDLKLLVRDMRTFVVLLALPVLFIYIIGMITGQLLGFNDPYRQLKIAIVDEIDYEAFQVDGDGEPLDEKEAAGRRKQARNTFVKIFNGIQETAGFQIEEVETDDRARELFQDGDVHVALRVGPDFFRRVLALSDRQVIDRSRGGLAFRFAVPDDLTEFADKRSGLEDRLGSVLTIDAGEIKVYRDNVDLENAEITFSLPDQAVQDFFDAQWNVDTDGSLLAALADAAQPLELQAVYPKGLAYGLESLDMRLESETPESSTHSMIEVIVLGSVLDAITLYPLCDNNQIKSRIATKCAELEAEADKPPLEMMEPQPVTKSSSRVYQEVIPGYTVLFVFFLINIMARSFIHERSLGTLRRLRIAPIRPISLLAGKTAPFLFVSLAQSALLFVFGKVFFGMSWGDAPWMLLPVIICTSLAATSLGLLVATIVSTEAQVSAYANLVVITTGLISGSMFPRNWLPELMQDISLITPHAWALIAYDELLSISATPPDLAVIWQCCAALIGFTVLFFTIGMLRFGNVD
jgi:ABC-type transport system involved in multi-copper enzyme maturation permease subunit